MQRHFAAPLAGITLFSLLLTPSHSETVQELNSTFREKMASVAKEQGAALIAYLKANPEAQDFGEALETLERLQVSSLDMSGLAELIQKRAAKAEQELAAAGADAKKALALVSELLRLGKYTGKPDDAPKLLERKYDLLLTLPEGKERLQEALGQGGVIPTLVNIYEQNRQKKEGLALVARIRKDYPQVKTEVLDSLEKAFMGMDSVGEPFALSFKSIDGAEIDLAKYKGKVVLVDFWATWCGPCVKAMPSVLALYSKLHDKGFEVLGISLDEDRGALDAFIKTRQLPWPQYFDGKGWKNDLAVAHGITAIPATYLIDKEGKLAAISLEASELEAKVTELLAK